MGTNHDANDRITKLTDWASREWSYAYTSGELTSVTSPAVTGFLSGKTTSYAYASGRLDTITDPKSQLILDATYDGSGKVTSLRYGDSGDDFSFSYDTPSTGKVTVTDRNGNDTVVTVDSNGHPSSVLEKTNRNVRSGEGDYTTSYAFNADGLLTQITFPEGNVAKYTYAAGTDDLTEETFENAAGTDSITSKWTYATDHHLVATYKEPRGATNDDYTTTYQYDFDEATAGDLNGDGVTSGTDGVLVKITRPTVTTQTPNITPSETFRYNANGQLTRWDRPDGEVTTFSYYTSGSQAGYLKKRIEDDVTAGLKLTTEWGYDSVGNMTSRKDPHGYTVSYTVNDLNQVTQETIPISATIDHDIKYEYGANDNLTKREVENLDETGTAYSNAWITTSWTYETLNRMATRVDEVSSTKTVTTTYTYDDNRNLTNVERPEGNDTKYEHDERDLIYQVTRGHGTTEAATERQSHTGNRLLETREFKHVDGMTTTWNTYTTTYDAFDRRTREEDPLGHRQEWAYDDAGNVTSVEHLEKDGMSYTTLSETAFTYTETGWLSKRTDKYRKDPADSPTDQDTTYEYRKDGQLSKVTDPRSNATTYTYDDAGRRTVTEDEYGNKITLTLDANGNVTKRELFDKAQAGSSSDVTRTIEYTHDRRNLMTEQVEDPGAGNLQLTTSWDRDSRGNVLTRTDPNGGEQTFTYDGRSLVLTRTEDMDSSTTTTTTYTYDDNGNLETIEDDNSNTTTYTYDALDRRTKRTNADLTTYTWEYDTEDRVTKRTDENGTVVEDTLDDRGQVTHRDITRATGVIGPDDEDYEWDGMGRLTEASNDDSEVTLKYDSLSRVHEESIKWLNGNVVTRTVKRDFDATGNVTKLTYPDTTAIDYVIDSDLDRIDQVKDGTTVLADYRWVGPFVDLLEYANGVDRTTSYDAVGRVTEVDHDDTGTTIAKFEYSYDDNGNVLYEKRTHNSSRYEVFEWDERNQLVTAYYDATASSTPTTYSEKVEFEYDGERNITECTATILGTPTNKIFTADSRNRYTGIGAASPLWTDNGELKDNDVGMTLKFDYRGQVAEVTKSGNTYTFEHDALGRRITTDFGTEVRYTWAGERIVEEISNAASPTVNATWDWGVDPEPIRMTRSSTESYYHANREGSVEKLTTAAAAVAESVEYTAHGKPSLSSSSLGNVFYWHGRFADLTTAIVQLERPYDPSLTLRCLVPRRPAKYSLSRRKCAGDKRSNWLLSPQSVMSGRVLGRRPAFTYHEARNPFEVADEGPQLLLAPCTRPGPSATCLGFKRSMWSSGADAYICSDAALLARIGRHPNTYVTVFPGSGTPAGIYQECRGANGSKRLQRIYTFSIQAPGSGPGTPQGPQRP